MAKMLKEKIKKERRSAVMVFVKKWSEANAKP
jgi:hypothetical protein